MPKGLLSVRVKAGTRANTRLSVGHQAKRTMHGRDGDVRSAATTPAIHACDRYKLCHVVHGATMALPAGFGRRAGRHALCGRFKVLNGRVALHDEAHGMSWWQLLRRSVSDQV